MIRYLLYCVIGIILSIVAMLLFTKVSLNQIYDTIQIFGLKDEIITDKKLNLEYSYCQKDEMLYNALIITNYRKSVHNNTFKYFTQLQMMLNVLKSILIGLITTIGLYLLKMGWEKANNVVLHLEFVFAGMLGTVQAIHTTFNIDHNIHTNKERTIMYQQLETSILKHTNIDSVEYTIHIINKLNSFYTITFDLENIPDDQYNIEYLEK